MQSYSYHQESTREALDTIGKMLDAYAVFPNREARDATILWVAHTWVFKQFEATPRLSIFSTEYGSGKSRVMDLVCGMSPDTISTVNARPSMIYNAIEDRERVVISIDELDMIFGPRGSSNTNKALLAIINEGFTSEGTVQSGSPGNYRTLSLFAPIVTAGKGFVPNALHTRSIRIPMRKANGRVKLEDYRLKKVRFQYAQVREVLDKWSRSSGGVLEMVDIDNPLTDRDADKWEPLLAIAALAGGDWKKRVSRAARLLERDDAGDELPLSTLMVRNIQTYVEEQELTEGDRIFTKVLVKALVDDFDWDPELISPRSIAKVLGNYGLEPGDVRVGKKVAKGYKVSDLNIAFNAA